MFCRNCGTQIPNNAQVCPSCGAPQGRTKFCSNCGSAVAMNAVMCPNCGAQLEATRAVAAAAPVAQMAQMPPIIINNTSSSNNSNTNNHNLNNANGGGSIYQNQNYGGNYGRRPVRQLRTNRSLLKTILLSLITFGIYAICVMYNVTEDVNTVCSPYDGKKSMNYLLLMFIFSWLTLGIAPIVWTHRLCNRMGNELRRRGIAYSFGAGTFWGWGVLGSLIIIGPFVFGSKLLKSMNLLAADYNMRG